MRDRHKASKAACLCLTATATASATAVVWTRRRTKQKCTYFVPAAGLVQHRCCCIATVTVGAVSCCLHCLLLTWYHRQRCIAQRRKLHTVS